MKSNMPFISARIPYLHLLTVVCLSLYTLSACQKTPESDTPSQDAAIETTSNAADIEPPAPTPDSTTQQQPAPLPAENTDQAPLTTAPQQTTTEAPPETLVDAQITDMRFESATGERISVVFTTSPSGILSAQLTLPSQAPITLDAPEGQGNNPTYRSNDGKVQLVSHAGGNRIDVIVNDTVTSYEATSVDARVVTTS